MFTNTKLRRMGIQIKVWLWSPWLFSLHSHLNGRKMQHLQGSYRTSNFMRTGDFWDWNSCIPRLKTMGFFQTDSRDKFKTITLLKIAYFTNTHFTFCYHWPLANTPVCVWLSDVNWSWAATKSLRIINLGQQRVSLVSSGRVIPQPYQHLAQSVSSITQKATIISIAAQPVYPVSWLSLPQGLASSDGEVQQVKCTTSR